MMVPRMRPRFAIPLEIPPEQAVAQLKTHLTRDNHDCVGSVVHRHVIICVNEKERTFWSPAMDFEILPREGGALIQGKFGPHPDVWTLFVALYALEAIGAIAGLMYGASQLTLDQEPWALWAAPAAGLAALVTYGSAFIGQALGARQMHRLESFLEGAIEGVIIDSHAA